MRRSLGYSVWLLLWRCGLWSSIDDLLRQSASHSITASSCTKSDQRLKPSGLNPGIGFQVSFFTSTQVSLSPIRHTISSPTILHSIPVPLKYRLFIIVRIVLEFNMDLIVTSPCQQQFGIACNLGPVFVAGISFPIDTPDSCCSTTQASQAFACFLWCSARRSSQAAHPSSFA